MALLQQIIAGLVMQILLMTALLTALVFGEGLLVLTSVALVMMMPPMIVLQIAMAYMGVLLRMTNAGSAVVMIMILSDIIVRT